MFSFFRRRNEQKIMRQVTEGFMSALLKACGNEPRVVECMEDVISEGIDDLYSDNKIDADTKLSIETFFAEQCGMEGIIRPVSSPPTGEAEERERIRRSQLKAQEEQQKKNSAVKPEKKDTAQQQQPDSNENVAVRQTSVPTAGSKPDGKKTMDDCPITDADGNRLSNNQGKKWAKNNGVNWDKEFFTKKADAHFKQPGPIQKLMNVVTGKDKKQELKNSTATVTTRAPNAPLPIPGEKKAEPEPAPQQQPKPQQQKPAAKAKADDEFADFYDEDDDRKAA